MLPVKKGWVWDVEMQESQEGRQDQQWFFDGNGRLRNRVLPDKVLEVDIDSYTNDPCSDYPTYCTNNTSQTESKCQTPYTEHGMNITE